MNMPDQYNLRSQNISIEETNEFLQGFPDNPFARIHCRSFERICSGVCGNCRKEREVFRVTRLQYWKDYFAKEAIRSGGDSEILQDSLTPEEILKAEIQIIQAQKEARFINMTSSKLQSQVIAQAMAERAAGVSLH